LKVFSFHFFYHQSLDGIIMLNLIKKTRIFFLLIVLALPLGAAFANNVLDAPMWDVVGVNGSQMLPPPAATASPIIAEPGALPTRWPNTGSLLTGDKKHKRSQSEQQTPNIPQITPMPAAPAGI
jgi:hypothetical protein